MGRVANKRRNRRYPAQTAVASLGASLAGSRPTGQNCPARIDRFMVRDERAGRAAYPRPKTSSRCSRKSHLALVRRGFCFAGPRHPAHRIGRFFVLFLCGRETRTLALRQGCCPADTSHNPISKIRFCRSGSTSGGTMEVSEQKNVARKPCRAAYGRLGPIANERGDDGG